MSVSQPRKGRGRPPKNKSTSVNASSNSDIISLVANAVNPPVKSRPKRAASKKAAKNFINLDDDPYNLISKMDVGDANQAFEINETPDTMTTDNDDYDADYTGIYFLEDNPPEEDGVEYEPDEDFVDDLIAKPKRKAANNTTKRAAKKTKVSAGRPSTNSSVSTLGKKGRIIRALKDLSSARDKVERLYGLNREKLLRLAKIKEGYETSLFNFPSENIEESSKYFVKVTPPCATENIAQLFNESKNYQHTVYNQMTSEEGAQIFTTRQEELSLEIADANYNLMSGNIAPFPTLPVEPRFGFVYNVGGLVTDIAWLNKNETADEDVYQYLAISVSQYFDQPLNKYLEMFNPETHISAVMIFRLNIQTLEFQKLQTILHPFGETWNLKWHEGFQDTNKLGLLGFVCQTGAVKFIEVDNVDNITSNDIIYYCETTSISISLPNTMITCFDFLSPTTIVCGFKNGYVAEFDLTDPEMPSYYRKIHDSYIINIVVAYSDFEDTVVSTVSVDGYFNLFDPKSISTTQTVISRFRGSNTLPVAYIPHLYALIYSDGANAVKAVPPRAAFAVHPVSLIDTTVSSVATSRMHPLALTGTADGAVLIENPVRRFLTTIKNTSGTHRSLKLWKWDYSEKQNKYRLDFNYQKYEINVNDVSKIHVDPQGINISAIKWIESSSAGKFYAFANSAGILTIERLT